MHVMSVLLDLQSCLLVKLL